MLGTFPTPRLRRFLSCGRPSLGGYLAILVGILVSLASAAEGRVESPRALPFSVEVHGPEALAEPTSHVFLIPGLGSPGSVWDGTVEALVADGHTAHVFHLAGFAGQPPLDSVDEFLPRVKSALADRARQLDSRPAIVGHSLGATLALWLAADEPELFGPIVAADGVAFLPALMDPNATPESTRPRAEGLRSMISGMTPAAYDQQTHFTLSSMITDPEDVKRMAEASRGSDPKTIAAAFYDLMTRDLRRALGTIESPVLLLAAGALAPNAPPGLADGLEERYRQQVATVPDHRVEMIEGARHFLMLDAPDRFLDLVRAHLSPTSTANPAR